MNEASKSSSKLVKPVIILVIFAGVIGALWKFGVFEYFSKENIGKLNETIEGMGIWGPVVYVVVYIFAVIFFLPGSVITLVAGVFGPVLGTILVSIASTIGAALSFLIARYAMRPMVEGWASKNPVFKKIDDGVEENGWQMVMLTRLVPIFPFNLQNYAYGLTKISFWKYTLVSWICMLPGTIAYVFAAGSIIGGEGNITKTLVYLAIAGVFFVGLSFLPKMLSKKYKLPDSEKEEPAS